MTDPVQGEVWWGELPNEKRRPYLVLTRARAIPVLRTVLVAPVSRRVRDIPTELPLGRAEGLPADCAASMDNIAPVPKAMLVERAGRLAPSRMDEMCSAVRAAIDC